MSEVRMAEVFRLPLTERVVRYHSHSEVHIEDDDTCDIGYIDGAHPWDLDPATRAAIVAINAHDDFVAQLDAANKRIAELEAQAVVWHKINRDQDLPAIGEWVLTSYEELVFVDYLDEEMHWQNLEPGIDPDAWAPLPEPYKEVGDEQ